MSGAGRRGRLRVGLVIVTGAGAGARGTGGAETVAIQQFGKLRDRVDLHLISDRPLHPGLEAIATDSCRIPCRSASGAAAFVPRLAGEIRRAELDVVLSEGPVSLDFLTAIACFAARCPHVVRRHVVIDDIKGSAVKKRAYRALDAVTRRLNRARIFLTEDQRVREGGGRLDHVVGNGIDLFAMAPPERERDGMLCVGMVGQFIAAKDWPAFLDVVERLRAKQGGVRALALGDGPLRPEIEEAARQRGIGGTIEFFGNVADVRPYLGQMDALLLTSRREGLSMACLEALAMGVPVVTTPVSGAGDIVGAGDGGVVVPFDAPGEAVRWLTENLATPTQRLEVSRRARQRAESRFDGADAARGVENILRSAARLK